LPNLLTEYTTDVGARLSTVHSRRSSLIDSSRALGARIRTDQSLKASADFTPTVVTKAGLTLDPDNDPERHVHILGWPEDELAELEARNEMARSSKLCVRPVGP